MKNFLAILFTIVIVLACAYGIYKQIDNFNKKNNPNETAYIRSSGCAMF